MVPTASNMRSALKALAKTLLINQIVDQSTYSNLVMSADTLRGNSRCWRYIVHPSKPLLFLPISNHYTGKTVCPSIYAHVEVDEARLKLKNPPFNNLVATLEVKVLETGIIAFRSHFDLANRNQKTGLFQSGPLFHLQYGGHSPGSDRADEFNLKEPRLMYPPIDLILASEIVLANFYFDKWVVIREQPAWKELISLSQQLCYSLFYNHIADCLEKRQPILNSVWAASWGC